MLFSSERHKKLTDTPWNKDLVTEVIKNIIDNTYQSRNITSGLWTIHPKDKFDSSPEFFTDFYMGSAGVVWALKNLEDINSKDRDISFEELIDLSLKTHLKISGQTPYDDKGSFFVGEAGIRLIKQLISPDADNEVILIQQIESKMDSLENELLYGLPGSLLMIHFLYEKLKKTEHLILQNKIIEKLLSTRVIDELSGALIWIQTFSEQKVRYIGAAHGTIGNYSILLRILRKQNNLTYHKDIIKNLETFLNYYARKEDVKCNWPSKMETDNSSKMLVHWCHGATGIVTELAPEIKASESQVIDELLIHGGNLIWEAGPLEKGTTICHGTAGSGMAFLKLFERTNDLHWLQKAQSFAMFAIDQYQQEKQEFGQERFSLWTGDLGLAIFLRDVLFHKASMPGLDIL